MKKLKHIIPLFIFISCCVFLSACGFTTTYVSPTITVDKIITSDIEVAANKAMLSGVSIYAEGKKATGSVISMGAGVIYKLDKNAGNAYIITNYHVVYDSGFNTFDHFSSNIYVELYGSEETWLEKVGNGVTPHYGSTAMSANVVGGSLKHDLAVLKISGSDILKNSSARQADISTSPAHLAQTVITVGNPLGNKLSVTKGIVSRESEYIKYSDFEDLIVRCIRIDAPINSGNSGGGLFDETGALLGIVNAGNSDAENIGSALPVPLVTNVCDNIIFGDESGLYKGLKEYDVGITVAGMNSKAVVDEGTGLVCVKEEVVVASLTSLTLTRGLQIGDLIASIQIGEEKLNLDRAFQFEEFLFKLRPGMKLTLTYINNGAHDITITPVAA